ncbi:MAG: phage tail tape measure protein [Umezawaea sp.]
MAKPIKVTILGDIKDLVDKLGQGENGIGAFASKVGGAATDVAASAAKFAAAGLAAGGIGGAILESLDRAQINAKLGAQLGATVDEAKRYGDAAGALYAKGYGDSFGQVSESIGAVVSTLGKFGSQGELEAVTKQALDVANAFNVDINRAVGSVGILLKTGLAKNAGEAFDLMTKGLQGVPAAVRDDLLEASDEYSVFFQGLGFSGAEAFGVLGAAAKGGKIQLDKAGDAIKEFRVRSVDMSKTSVDAYTAIGLNAEDMAKKILGGGEGAKAAFQQILDGILSIDDPVKKEAAAVGLFGTQFEDLGNLDALAALRPMTNALTGVAGATDALGKSLHDNASANLDVFTRSVTTAFVDLVGGYVIPLVNQLATFLNTNLGPALAVIGAFVTGTVVPALQALAQWVGENESWLRVVAGVITALFLPALIKLGIESLISGAKSAAGWVMGRVAAVGSALAQSGAAVMIVARWGLMAGAAVAGAARTVGAWLLAQTGAVASGVAMVASMAVTAASVVGGWALMGVQSLIRAAQMAAAWVLAMGPVGWIIAAVVALVALIIANWDTVVDWTKKAWAWLVDAIVAAARFIWDYFLKWSLVGLIITYWDDIVAGVRAAVAWVLDAVSFLGRLPGMAADWFAGVYNAAVGKLRELVSWLGGLGGQVLGAIGNLGSLLTGAGRDLLSGLWSGIQGAAGWLRDRVLGFFSSIMPNWVRDALGIHSPSRVMAGIARWIPPGIAAGIDQTAHVALSAASGLATDIAGAVAGTDFGSPLAFALGAAGAVGIAAGTGTASRGDQRGSTNGNGVGAAGTTHQEINVNVTSNADPDRIGREVAWALRTTGR